MSEFKLPDVGEGLTEAEIVTWKVKVGDAIEINDIVVEIETAKSLVELPSPYAGTVLALLVPEGETVAVGTPIISIGDPTEAPAPRRRPGRTAAAPRWRSTCPTRRASGGGEGESLVGRNKADRGPAPPRPQGRGVAGDRGRRRRPRCSCRARSRPAVPSPPDRRGRRAGGAGDRPRAAESAPAESVGGRLGADVRALAKPPVRKLAKDLGVDLATLDADRPDGIDHPRGRRGRAASGAVAGSTDVGSACRASPRSAASARPASRSRASAR